MPVAQVTRRILFIGSLAWASAAAAAGSGKAPPVVTLLGDSITAGLGLPAADALPAQLQAALERLGVRTLVRGAGVSGDTTAGALARTDFSVQPDTAVCVIELGGNDFLQAVPPAEVERNLLAIIAKLKRRRIKVVLATARLPSGSLGDYGREFAAVYPKVARRTGVAMTSDLLAGVEARQRQADQLHLNGSGVRLLAERIAPSVAGLLRSPEPGRKIRV